VQVFVLDSDPREPALGYSNASSSTQSSAMGQWLKGALAGRARRGRFVVLHHAHSPARTRQQAWMQYPYHSGADAVLAGTTTITSGSWKNGLPLRSRVGGAELRTASRSPAEPGSAGRYAADYGAMKVDATDTSLAFRFITRAR